MTWDMVGHSWAETLLQKHIKTQRVRHAYLISGDEGVGKRTLALKFAMALNCSKDGEKGKHCQQCRACTLIPAGLYPDMHEITPEQGTTSIKVDQVRELMQQLALSPYESRWRIALIADFERATEEAANALLKTLEEPPEKVVVILTARDPASLLPTIVSRCEELPLRAVVKEEIIEELKKREVSEDRAALIAGIAQGRPGWAIRYADEPEKLEAREEIIGQLSQTLQASISERFDYVGGLLSPKEDLDIQRQKVLDLLRIWMGVWRDALQRSFNPEMGIVNRDQSKLVEIMNMALDSEALHGSVKAVQRTQEAIEHFVNIRLALEVLMLDLPFIRE
jgi:DNA polymerase-3 subunit delta'